MLLFVLFNIDEYTGERLLPVALLFAQYGLAVLPLMYCATFMFKTPSVAFIYMTIFSTLAAGVTLCRHSGTRQLQVCQLVCDAFLFPVIRELSFSHADLHTCTPDRYRDWASGNDRRDYPANNQAGNGE